MKIVKYLSIVALLLVPFAAQLNAQQAVIAGSSALWLETGEGAYVANGGTATTPTACIWTEAKGSYATPPSSGAYVEDTRPSSPAYDVGNLWVVWTTGGGSCSSPVSPLVYAYINTDSTIGNRCLFGQPACTLFSTGSGSTTSAAEVYPLCPQAVNVACESPIPSGVLSLLTAGTAVTIAATDILPTDSRFATLQALSPGGPLSPGTQYIGYGYGPGPVGTQIQGPGGPFNVVDFNIVGNDPFTNTAVPSFTITPVGAAPVLVFVNTGNASGFGVSTIQNVDRMTLALAFSSVFARTADFIAQPGGGAGPFYGFTAYSRESLSGTYNVFDRAINNNKEIYRPQEIGNYTTGSQGVATNPLDRTLSVGGQTYTHERAIGTGKMISTVIGQTDSIGYAFWSAGNFAAATYGPGTAGTLKYLTVDGVDPLCHTYGCGGNAGQIPTAGNGLLPNVTLEHVADGSYPIWSEQRFVTLSSSALTQAQTIAGWAQSQVSFGSGATQPDWITAPNLNVFHQHFNLPIITDNTAADGPRVCGPSGAVEQGGDAGGMVLTLQAGADYAILKGNYNTSSCIGPTNTASWGVHQ
jgi:hypothetical protein